MTVAAYDADQHHIGLGVTAGTLKGFILAGPYNRQPAGPVLDKPSDIGTDDLTGQRSMSRWTQADYSGGEFQEDWADAGMFAECISMIPNQLSRSIRTTQPVKLARGGQAGVTWDSGLDLIGADNVDGFVYFYLNSAGGQPRVLRLNPSSPSGTGVEIETAPFTADHIIKSAAWNYGGERLWLGSNQHEIKVCQWDQTLSAGSRLVLRQSLDPPGMDLPDPTVAITGIHIFGSMKFIFTGHGDADMDDNQAWLYVDNLGATTKWAPVGYLPGAYVTSCTYNNAVYILCRKGDSQTSVVMTQGDQIFPVLTIPYYFYGQSMIEYAGRLYIGGVGGDLEGDVHHGELYEINGTSLRLVRTFAQQYEIPDPPVDIYHPNRKRTMRHFKAMTVAEGLLWMPDSSYTGCEIYDATTDAFFGGPRLRTGDDPNLEFTKMVSFGDSIYLWGVSSNVATTGWYRTERRSDAGGSYTAYLSTSDFHPEPAMMKVWSRFAVLSRYQAPAMDYSLDSGLTWTTVTPESTTTQGNRYERQWSLASVGLSRAIRFRLRFSMAGTANENAGELVAHSLSFLIKGELKRRWQLQINAANNLRGALDSVGGTGAMVEQVPDEITQLLWSYLDGTTHLVFRDIDGRDHDVVITDVEQNVVAVTRDAESFVTVTLLEV